MRLTVAGQAQRPVAPVDLNRPMPWALSDLSRLARFGAISLIGIVVCFVGARHTKVWSDQLYWVVGGMAAILLAGVGWTSWLLVGARGLRERQRRVGRAAQAIVAARRPEVLDTTLLVSSPTMTHYHRPDCLLARGRSTSSATLVAHESAGRTPCGICLS